MNNNTKNKRFARKPRRTSAAATVAPVSSEGGVVLEEEKEEKNDVDDDEIIIIEESLKNNEKKSSKTPSKTTTTTSKTKRKKIDTNNNKSSDKNDPYSFENAKELFGKVDEEILVEDDDDEEEEDVDAQAEKYFVANRVALFGKALMIQKSNINKKSKEEVKEVKEVKEDSIKEPTTKLIVNNKNRRVSFAMDQEEVKEEEVKEEQLKEEEEVKEDKNEVLFDDALATEIKLTPEKPIQFKRQKTPSPVKQIIITKAVQSSDPQTHLQVLEKYGGGNGINNIIKNNFQEEEQRTLASTLWLLKKIASNTQYRRRLSRERPHFATSMFTAALKIAGKSAADAKLRLAAIALAYLFSLEIKTFSRVLDSMDIALGVAACVDEANFFTEEEEEKKEEIMVVIEDDTNDIDGDVEKAVETSLSALKFLPSEKSACTKNIALLLAFRALQWGSEEEEEKERREGGKQPPTTTTTNSDTTSRALRTRLSRSGFITSVAKLANESCKDLVQSLHSSKIKSKKGEDKEEGEEMKVKARKACARLFRCARVIEAATYTSPETVTTLASSNLPVWESFSSSSFISDEDKSKDVEDDAFGEPSPTINNASSSTSSFSVLKLADVSLLAIEEEEEEDDVDDGRKMVTATATNPTTTTAAISTPPRPIPGSNRFEDNDDDTNTNNNSFLQIGSPATVGASPVFGQMAKSPGAALDSWLAKSPKDGDVDMSPKPRGRGGGEKGIKNNRNDNNSNNNSKKNNWSLARCLIETLPALTLLTSRSMRPRAKALHGIQTSEYLNPNIDARLSLATLKACVFALTNSTNENTVGAKAAASRDGLHGIIAAVAYFSAMRGCALYGEFAGFVPKKDNMEGTVPDAYKEAATELLHACMCLLVNITEANPRAKQELLQLQLDCSPFGTGKAEDFKKKKKKKKTNNNGMKILDDDDEKSASPLVPFPTVLARIFTHAGGAKMHRVEDDDDEDDEDDDDQNQDDDGDDEDEEVTVEMLDDDDDATANATVDPSYGEDLITQAYSSLLLAFLVENDREALRRTADHALPKGGGKRKRNGNARVSGASGESVGGTKNGVQAMVDTLERFHAFHDTLDAMSASSSESLKRVVEWLKSTLV